MTLPVLVAGCDHAKCANCGKLWQGYQLKPMADIQERIEAGGEVPAGECPACGALSYIVKEKK